MELSNIGYACFVLFLLVLWMRWDKLDPDNE
jgi:hypothetical protein